MADWLALSVRPPWSWAIVHASKDVENRTGGAGRWRRALNARLMIHASSRWSRSGAADPRVCAAWWDITNGSEWDRRFGEVPKPQHIAGGLVLLHPSVTSPDPHARIHLGVVIGAARVVDVHDAEEGCCESEWAEYRYTDAAGQLRTDVVHLVLAERRCIPGDGFPARGRLGLWRPSPELVADVEDELA